MFWNKKKPEPEKAKADFSEIDTGKYGQKVVAELNSNLKRTFTKDIIDFKITEPVMKGNVMFAQDASQLQRQKVLSGANATGGGYGGGVNLIQLNFFAQQSFIGYQVCGLLAQNWLINKTCIVPARDAVRNGYKITVNDGVEVPPEKLQDLRDMDKEFNINAEMIDYIYKGRIFGIRIAMFLYDGVDYEKPFNIDGIKKNSYKGISQIDPYWITPELDIEAASNPASPNFYRPTWWRINGKRIHYTHLAIFVPYPVVDILKPTYIFGGVSLPQLIHTRVYAAEKCANESPILLLTKRTDILKCDMAQAIANQEEFEARLKFFTNYRDNDGIKTIDAGEDIERLDTALADVDETIMTQYQLCAAIGGMPATKLIETTPKGFNSTGDYEEASYHENLESIQTNDLTPFLARHHALCIKSRISPADPFTVVSEWESLDAMTAAEKADVRKKNADADKVYVDAGAVDGEDLRKKIIADPDSGFNGIEDETEDDIGEEDNDTNSGLPGDVENGKTVQQISMNGAQVLSLVQILTNVASKTMPPDSAKAAIAAAFNTLTPEEIDSMVDPMAIKAKKDPIEQPTPNPGEKGNEQFKGQTS